MQRFSFSSSSTKNFGRKIHYHRNQIQPIERPCDVFINNRGRDTKRTFAGLLYNNLLRLRLNPFMDSKNMKPGDRLFDKIETAIRHCKVGVAVFSPHYCESYFCLYELDLIMKSKKKIIPIFYDVKPSQFKVRDDGTFSNKDLQRFRCTLEEAKHRVGLPFDSLQGDWSDFLIKATNAVIENLIKEDIINREWRLILI